MRVQVQLFAGARDRMGRSALDLELPDRSTVLELRRRLAEEFPQLAPIVARSMIAVDAQYAGDDATVRSASEIALIPPVSGG